MRLDALRLPLSSPRAAFSGIAQLPTATPPARSGRGCCSVAGWGGFFAPSRCYSDCEPGRAATPRHVAAVSTAAARRVCGALSGTGAPRGCAGAGGSGAGLPPRSPAGRRAVRCLPALGSFLRRAAGGAREGRCQVPGVDFGGVAGFPLTGMDAQPCSRQGVGTASNAVEQSNDSGT